MGSKALVGRMDTVKGALSALNTESETEAAKFGEDVKYLADVTNSTKKFDPWIAKSEERVKTGMKNAGSLEEGKKTFDEVKHWKAESEAIKTVLDNGNASAQKMTNHGEADKVYAAHQEVGSGGQSHQGMDHKDGGSSQNVGGPSS